MIWWMWAMAAHGGDLTALPDKGGDSRDDGARAKLGLAANPEYEQYARIVEELGLVLDREPMGQIMEGVVNVMLPKGPTLGEVYTTRKDPGPSGVFRRYEQWVLFDPASAEAINSTGFLLEYQEMLCAPVECEVAELEAAYLGWEEFVGSPHDLVYKDPPDASQYLLADLQDPDLTLFAFEMTQSGDKDARGWLLRERRYLGAQGVKWVDHWLITDDWKWIREPGDTGSVLPVAGFASVAGFMSAHADDAKYYARATYHYSPLGDLLPDPVGACDEALDTFEPDKECSDG